MSEFKRRLIELFAWIIALIGASGLVLFASYLDSISPWFGYVAGGAIILITIVCFVNWLFIEPFRKRCRK
jgi:hypothetical protein